MSSAVLGLSFHFHDSAAALVVDGRIVAAAAEERFSRRKHDAGFPHHAIRFCLESAGLQAGDLSAVAYYERPELAAGRKLSAVLASYPRSWPLFRHVCTNLFGRRRAVSGLIARELGISRQRVEFVDHHVAHGASAYFASPFDDAAVLTVDGVGEWSSATIGRARGTELVSLRELHFPHSVGLLYSAFTAFLGFEVNEGEYKVMGLAGYGSPRFIEEVRRVVTVFPDGSIWLDCRYFDFPWSRARMFNERFTALFGPPRPPDRPLAFHSTGGMDRLAPADQHYADIAASIQWVVEDILVRMARHACALTGSRRLCMAGGVALNCLANSRIRQEAGVDDLYIQPAAGDDGAALGAALHVSRAGAPRRGVMDNAYWGLGYDDAGIHESIRRAGWRSRRVSDADRLADEVAAALEQGRIVAWFQGRFEWGPRALGNRSILADPRRSDTKRRVNERIKFREPFRPFAPAMLQSHVDEYFDGALAARWPSRFMLLAERVRPEAAARIPAACHAGTARVQVVAADQNPAFHRVISRFHDRTGVPAVVNTSFNLRGEPMVASPADAISTFERSGLDVLVMGEHWLERKEGV